MNSELLYHFWIQWNKRMTLIIGDQMVWQGPSGAVIHSRLTTDDPNWLALDVENAAIIQEENDTFLLRNRLQFVPIVRGLLDWIIEEFESSVGHSKIIQNLIKNGVLHGPYIAGELGCLLKYVDTINKIGYFVAVREALSPLPLPISKEIYTYFTNPAND